MKLPKEIESLVTELEKALAAWKPEHFDGWAMMKEFDERVQKSIRAMMGK